VTASWWLSWLQAWAVSTALLMLIPGAIVGLLYWQAPHRVRSREQWRETAWRNFRARWSS
jgi:hypothetical protein